MRWVGVAISVTANLVLTSVYLVLALFSEPSRVNPLVVAIVTACVAALGLVGSVISVGLIPIPDSRRAGILGVLLGLLPIPLAIVEVQVLDRLKAAVLGP
jgi:hypothetical protein